MRLPSFLAQLLLKQFSEGFVCAVGRWLIAGNAADQIGDLVIEAIRKDGICTFGNGIANDVRFGNVREPRGLAEPCFSSGIKANAFHRAIVLQMAQKCITAGNRF